MVISNSLDSLKEFLIDLNVVFKSLIIVPFISIRSPLPLLSVSSFCITSDFNSLPNFFTNSAIVISSLKLSIT